MRLPGRALCAIVVAFVSPAASCLVLRMMILPFFFVVGLRLAQVRVPECVCPEGDAQGWNCGYLHTYQGRD